MLKQTLFLIFLINLPQTTFAQSRKDIKVVMLGDSLTEGYGIASEKSFPALLEKKLKVKHPQIKVINAGISGSTSASAKSRLEWQLKSQPQLIVLSLGANDGLRGLSTTNLSNNLAAAIELAKKENVKIILTGMQMPTNYGKDYQENFAAVFGNLAKKYKIPLMPFLLDGVATLKEFNQADGIHPNEKGHEIIANKLLPYIEKEL